MKKDLEFDVKWCLNQNIHNDGKHFTNVRLVKVY